MQLFDQIIFKVSSVAVCFRSQAYVMITESMFLYTLFDRYAIIAVAPIVYCANAIQFMFSQLFI